MNTPVSSLTCKRAERAVDQFAADGRLIRRGDGTLIEPDRITSPANTLQGVSIDHSCGHRLGVTVTPGYLHSSGPHFHGVVTFTAGPGPDEDRRSVDVALDDVPALIAALQSYIDAQQEAGDSMVPGWQVL
jgi:hypothetical protein